VVYALGMRLRGIGAALVGAMALVALASPGAAPAQAIGGPLPSCRIADVPASPSGYDDWAITLVDWTYTLGKDYKPPDLVSVNEAGLPGGGLVRKLVINDLRALTNAARANGSPIGSWSPYRSYSTQVRLFNDYSRGYGYRNAITFSARPGHSEHQLGTTIDFSVAGGKGLLAADTRAAKWLAANSWKYGWILSYPNNKASLVCYTYEPWHFRYFGRALAAKIHASGLTSRQYLWANFTTADPVTGSPIPTASVSPSAPAGASASPASVEPGSPSPAPSGPAGASPAATEPVGPGTATSSDTGSLVVLLAVVVLLVVAGVLAARTLLGRPRRR